MASLWEARKGGLGGLGRLGDDPAELTVSNPLNSTKTPRCRPTTAPPKELRCCTPYSDEQPLVNSWASWASWGASSAADRPIIMIAAYSHVENTVWPCWDGHGWDEGLQSPGVNTTPVSSRTPKVTFYPDTSFSNPIAHRHCGVIAAVLALPAASRIARSASSH